MNEKYTLIQYSVILLFILFDSIVLVQIGLFKRQFRRIYTNISFYLITLIVLIPVNIQSIIISYHIRVWLWHGNQLISLFSKNWSVIASGLVGFLLLDFFNYFQHRGLHCSLFLMRIHGMHHLLDRVDSSATLKVNVFESMETQLLIYVVWTLFNVPYQVILLYVVVDSILGLCQHCYSKILHLPPHWNFIHKILTTPNVHHLHHLAHAKYFNSNFGAILSCWDVLFGTYESPAELPVGELEYGLPYARDTEYGFLRQLILPYEKVSYIGKKRKLMREMDLANKQSNVNA